MATDDLTIIARIRDELSQGLDRIRRGLRGAGDEASRTDRVLGRLGNAGRSVRRGLADANRGLDEFTARTTRAAASFRNALGGPGGMILMAGALAGALSPALGAIALLPALAAAGGAAFGALKLGMSGFAETITEADPKKYAEGLAKLAPNARLAAGAIRSLQPSFSGLRLDVQNALFAGLNRTIRSVVTAGLPVIRTGLVGIATEFSNIANRVGAFLTLPQTLRDTALVLGNTRTATRNLGGAVVPLLQAFRDLAAVGSTFLPGLATGAANAARSFAALVARARESGQLRTFIQDGLNALRDLGIVIMAVIRGVAASSAPFGLFSGSLGLMARNADTVSRVISIALPIFFAYRAIIFATGVAHSVAAVAVGGYRAAVMLANGAVKAYTIVQYLLNAALNANPFVRVGILLAALIGIVITAYRQSETFRRIVDGAFRVVAETGRWLWNDMLRPAFRSILTTFLDMAISIVSGAGRIARALGMNGLADKLDAAKGELAAFKESALRSLDIPDQRVNVVAYGALKMPAGVSQREADSFARQDAARAASRRANGGPILGLGSGRGDKIPTYLSSGEHVVTAKEVRAAGGHHAIAAWRRSLVQGLADGGPAMPVHARGDTGTMARDSARFRDLSRAVVGRAGQRAINAIAEQAKQDALLNAGGGDPGRRPGATPAGNRGLGPAARRARAFAVGRFGMPPGGIGGYSYRNIGGTNKLSKHALGKALDFMTHGNTRMGYAIANYFAGPGRARFGVDNVIYMRRITNRGRGWRWGRYTGQNPHTDHPHVDFYDRGGLARGRGMLAKRTIRPERVLSPEQTAAFDRLVDHLTRDGGGGLAGGGVNITINVDRPAATVDVELAVRRAIARTELVRRERR